MKLKSVDIRRAVAKVFSINTRYAMSSVCHRATLYLLIAGLEPAKYSEASNMVKEYIYNSHNHNGKYEIMTGVIAGVKLRHDPANNGRPAKV